MATQAQGARQAPTGWPFRSPAHRPVTSIAEFPTLGLRAALHEYDYDDAERERSSRRALDALTSSLTH